MARTGEGQTALVTGASMGIGVDLAECFAQDGYDLILTARSEAALKNVAATPLRPAQRQGDADSLPISAFRAAARSWRPRSPRAASGRRTGEQCRATASRARSTAPTAASQLGMIDLNDRALVELTHIYWPRMLANKRGGVLNVASTASFQPGPLMAIYYASKAFVLSFSEALWKEAEGTGVHVSCLCPGPTASNFRERAGTGKTRLSRNGPPMSSAAVADDGLPSLAEEPTRDRSPARATPCSPASSHSCRGARCSASSTICRVRRS